MNLNAVFVFHSLEFAATIADFGAPNPTLNLPFYPMIHQTIVQWYSSSYHQSPFYASIPTRNYFQAYPLRMYTTASNATHHIAYLPALRWGFPFPILEFEK